MDLIKTQLIESVFAGGGEMGDSEGALVGKTRSVLADAILTAVPDNCLSGDKGGTIACQEQNRARHVLGFSQPLGGLLFPGGAFVLFRSRCDCQCIR
jgi:hypothetical protein